LRSTGFFDAGRPSIRPSGLGFGSLLSFERGNILDVRGPRFTAEAAPASNFTAANLNYTHGNRFSLLIRPSRGANTIARARKAISRKCSVKEVTPEKGELVMRRVPLPELLVGGTSGLMPLLAALPNAVCHCLR